MPHPSHGLAIGATFISFLALIILAGLLAYPGLVLGDDDFITPVSNNGRSTINDDNDAKDDKVEVKVKNESTDEDKRKNKTKANKRDNNNETLTNDEIAALPVEPNARISVNGDQQGLRGDRHVDIKVNVPSDEKSRPHYIKSVDVLLRRPGSPVELFIGTATQDSSDTWRAGWDTTQTPNGTYRILALL